MFKDLCPKISLDWHIIGSSLITIKRALIFNERVDQFENLEIFSHGGHMKIRTVGIVNLKIQICQRCDVSYNGDLFRPNGGCQGVGM